MAENFEDVVKKLGNTVKKPTAAKAPAVLAVQIVDSKGKVIKEKKGAAVAEAKREEEKREKKTNTLLDNILKVLGVGGGGRQRDSRGRFTKGGGGFLKSILPGLLPAAAITALGGMAVLGKLGIGAVVLGGVYSATKAIGDGLEGMDWAKSMGMEKETGFIARFFGGSVEGGLMNAFKQSMAGAAMGATLGMAGGPVGMIVGALLGAALFGIAGWFGAGALAKMIDPLVQDARRLFGLTVNVTPEELEDAKKVAATTQQMKTDAISNVEKLTKQLTEAQAATEPDQKLIDNLILLKAKAMEASLEAHINHEKAASKSLLLDRASERNAVIIAEDAVAANEKEIRHLNSERSRFERQLKLYGEDTIEGQNAAAQLEKIRVKLRKTRTEGETLREEEAAAEAVLLEEDRRLIQKAKDEGGTAPWRARFNVWTTDTWSWVKDGWKKITTIIPTWFANNIFDPGSAGGIDMPGSPMRIFGVAIPSMEKIKTTISESWSTFKASAETWFADNIFDSGTPMRIFGIAIPSMPDLSFPTREDILDLLPEWMTNPLRTIRKLVARLTELLPWPFNADLSADPEAVQERELAQRGTFSAGTERMKAMLAAVKAGVDASALMAINETFGGGAGFAAGGPFRAGQAMIVGELGPEMILPDQGGQVINAQRTQQMLQAGILRGMGGGAGGGITSINTGGNIVSSPTTNYVNNGIAARRPIILAA